MNAILDASALLALLRAEPGEDVVMDLLTDPGVTCYVHAANLYEVFYLLLRETDEVATLTAIRDLQDAGVIVREDLDTAFWQDAGRLKAQHPMSPPDSFGVALARRLGGEFVTDDHREIDPLVPLGLCRIRFIR